MPGASKKRNGIIAAGNWIVDHLKVIDTYPAQDSLANIKEESFSNGGSPYNVLKNLAKLGAPFPLKAIGLVGEDEYGNQIRQDCAKYGIDATTLKVLPHSSTSYTDVMTVKSSGRRTFFHQRGANAFLDVGHFDFSSNQEKIFHLGYLLLLDALDKIYEDGSSGASRVLRNACESGLKTSVDLVSEDSDRFKKVVAPALPYIDFLFLNEFEAARLTGIDVFSDKPESSVLNRIATVIMEKGVRECVFIHFPKGVFAKSRTGEITTQGAVDLPSENIVGAVGAGDALASGVLFGIHEERPITEALKLGVCSAASCLRSVSCSNGVLPVKECLKLADTYGCVSWEEVDA
jgi:sugar/nucleoside kinase (ribokinase family)